VKHGEASQQLPTLEESSSMNTVSFRAASSFQNDTSTTAFRGCTQTECMTVFARKIAYANYVYEADGIWEVAVVT
jgi:hypothetical protein